MGTTSSGSMRSSAGCRYSAGISLYSAHNGTIRVEESLLSLIINNSSIGRAELSRYTNIILTR